MPENEIGMLEKWVEFLESGVSLKDSVNKLADIPDYSPVFAQIAKALKIGSSFQAAMLENKDSFSASTVILGRLGEYADIETKDYVPKKRPNNCLIENLKKAYDFIELNEKYHPDKRTMEEMLLCYSVGETIGEGVPILDAFTSVANNFKEFNCYTPESALRYFNSEVRMGSDMSEPMSRQSFFHPETIYLSFIGENTGDLDKALKKSTEILEAKVKYNLLPKQTEDVLFYYGWGILAEAGLPFTRSMEILKNSCNLASFGPNPEVFDQIIQDYDAKKPLKENLAKHDYFTLEVLNQISGDEINLEAELMDISKYFENKYFY